MAGIDLTGDRRSQLLEILLAQQVQKRQRPIRSGGELAARLGAQLIRQQGIKKLQGEEAQSQQDLLAALKGRLPGSQVTLEGFDDVPEENIPIQGRQVGVDEALSRRPPRQQMLAKALTEPGFRERLELETAARRSLQVPEKDKVTTKMFREGNDFVTREVINGRPGKELSRSKIDRRQQIEQGPPGSFQTKSAQDEETNRKRAVLTLTGEMAESLRNVQENPRSTGMIGAGADVANRLGDLPVVGSWITSVTKELTNLSPTELSEVRTQGASMIGKLVPVITGDTSGRYTDREQERTENIQKQSQFWTTAAQVTGGLGELQSISLRGEIRQNGAEGLAFLAGEPLDLTNDDDIEKWGETLMEQYGLPFDKAIDEIEKHQRMLGQ
jgi:hypothetical protein